MDKRTGKKKKTKGVKPETQATTMPPQQAPVIVPKKTDTKHK
jgi:hypothetical protein